MKRVLLTLVAVLALAPAARAETVTEEFRVGPVEVRGYEVKVDELDVGIPHPRADAKITHMDVDLVDADGAQVPIQRLMLHHIVFLKIGARDASCSEFTAFDDMTELPNLAQRFFAAGEERMELDLPPGYGYPVEADDTWALTSMVMNHRAVTDEAYIRYRVTYDTDPAVKPVTPVWMDVENCRADPAYDVPGRGRATHVRTHTWNAPEGGRIVAAGGHVHGGGKRLDVEQPGCEGRRLFSSEPLWGRRDHPFYNVRPVLHEPGPVSMSAVRSAQGWPLAAGERIELVSRYDGLRPHTRVMGVLIAYFAPDAAVTGTCGAAPTDVESAQVHPQAGRAKAPKVTVPLTGLNAKGQARTIRRPPGPLRRGTRVRALDFAFSKPNLRVRRNAKVRWAFPTGTLHNVTLASGPEGFSSPNLSEGRRYAKRLRRRGTYRLFCGLHPVSMTQRIVVR